MASFTCDVISIPCCKGSCHGPNPTIGDAGAMCHPLVQPFRGPVRFVPGIL